MHKIKLGVLVVLSLAVVAAHAQTSVRVRGTITAVDAGTLSLKTREGRDLKIALPETATVAVAKAVRFDEIKDGDYVGVTSKRSADGNEVAVEVHYLAATTPPGQIAWDLEPNSKMTNANVQGKVVGTGSHELMLQFPGGTQKILVPEGIPLVRTVPGTRSDLKPGEYVFLAAQATGDGGLAAQRVQVSKDGVRPPQ